MADIPAWRSSKQSKGRLHDRWHTHPGAHGIYVTLVSHQGSHPAGSFAWFPEGGKMQHEASADGDGTFPFITNRPFGIQHVFGEDCTGS